MNLRVPHEWTTIMLLSILLGVVSRPLDVLIGYLLGIERYWVFVIVFSISIILGVVSELVWWKVMSSIKEK